MKFKNYWYLSFICLGQLDHTNYLARKLNESEAKCTVKIQVIERKWWKALAEKQNVINQVSADYDQVKSEQRTKVEKIIDRPVYNNVCLEMMLVTNQLNYQQWFQLIFLCFVQIFKKWNQFKVKLYSYVGSGYCGEI